MLLHAEETKFDQSKSQCSWAMRTWRSRRTPKPGSQLLLRPLSPAWHSVPAARPTESSSPRSGWPDMQVLPPLHTRPREPVDKRTADRSVGFRADCSVQRRPLCRLPATKPDPHLSAKSVLLRKRSLRSPTDDPAMEKGDWRP